MYLNYLDRELTSRRRLTPRGGAIPSQKNETRLEAFVCLSTFRNPSISNYQRVGIHLFPALLAGARQYKLPIFGKVARKDPTTLFPLFEQKYNTP